MTLAEPAVSQGEPSTKVFLACRGNGVGIHQGLVGKCAFRVPASPRGSAPCSEVGHAAREAVPQAILDELENLRAENQGLRESLRQAAFDAMPLDVREVAEVRIETGLIPPSATACRPSLYTVVFAVVITVALTVAQTLVQEAEQCAGSSGEPLGSSGHAHSAPSIAPLAARIRGRGREKLDSVDENYFDSYSGLDIHREMLSDEVRDAPTNARMVRQTSRHADRQMFVASGAVNGSSAALEQA
jgi:hypothetical protein